MFTIRNKCTDTTIMNKQIFPNEILSLQKLSANCFNYEGYPALFKIQQNQFLVIPTHFGVIKTKHIK